MAKKITYGDDGRKRLLEGTDAVTDAVQVTLGPAGRSVLLEKKWGAPTIARDGIEVAREIEIPDPVADAAQRMVRQACQKTADEVGDGTATAAVLARAVVREGIRQIAAGGNPQAIRRGIEAGIREAVDAIEGMSREVRGREEITRIGTLSAQNKEDIGEILAEAFEKVSRDGAITVEEGRGTATELDLVDGMEFDRGYLSPHFLQGADLEAMEVSLEDPLILLHDKKISAVQDILPCMQAATDRGKPLVVIAEDVEGDALATLVVNNQRGTLRCVAVKAPAYGDRRKEMLQDLAVLTGGSVVSADAGMSLERLSPADMGTCARVLVTKDDTTVVGGGGSSESIEGRKEQIRVQIENTDSDYDREKLEERLARLSGGVAVVRVGAPTEAEVKERKRVTESALNTVRAAVDEGVVPGGGIAYLRAAQALQDCDAVSGEEGIGVEILSRALLEPLKQIATNAGLEGSAVAAKALEKEGAQGLDVSTGTWGDVTEMGILDPAKVVRVVVQNAASMAGVMLTTEALVTEIPEKKKAGPAAPPGMGGMEGMGGMGGF